MVIADKSGCQYWCVYRHQKMNAISYSCAMFLHLKVHREEQALVLYVMTVFFVLIIIVKKSGFKTLPRLFYAYYSANGNVLI